MDKTYQAGPGPEAQQSDEQSIALEGLLPCPFCGDTPGASNAGAYVEIDCCCHMSFQKSDYLTIEERGRWNKAEYKYHPDLEKKVWKICAAQWNRREGLRESCERRYKNENY